MGCFLMKPPWGSAPPPLPHETALGPRPFHCFLTKPPWGPALSPASSRNRFIWNRRMGFFNTFEQILMSLHLVDQFIEE